MKFLRISRLVLTYLLALLLCLFFALASAEQRSPYMGDLGFTLLVCVASYCGLTPALVMALLTGFLRDYFGSALFGPGMITAIWTAIFAARGSIPVKWREKALVFLRLLPLQLWHIFAPLLILKLLPFSSYLDLDFLVAAREAGRYALRTLPANMLFLLLWQLVLPRLLPQAGSNAENLPTGGDLGGEARKVI